MITTTDVAPLEDTVGGGSKDKKLYYRTEFAPLAYLPTFLNYCVDII